MLGVVYDMHASKSMLAWNCARCSHHVHSAFSKQCVLLAAYVSTQDNDFSDNTAVHLSDPQRHLLQHKGF